MLDKYIVPVLKPTLRRMAERLQSAGITADQLTTVGFTVGLCAVVAVALKLYVLALVLMLLNRLADGIDGELARRKTPTDAGGYLDITLDFIFYSAFPLGFAFSDPAVNALPAAVLIASFMGTGSSFLAFSSLASQRGIDHPDFAYKSLYYLDGLAEGTETILCFVLMCLFPLHFAIIAYSFSVVCLITTFNRVFFGYRTLRTVKD